MPTQEDRVTSRIKQLNAFLRDEKDVAWSRTEFWAYVTLGVRPKTTSLYLLALISMGVITTDEKHQTIHYVEKKGEI